MTTKIGYNIHMWGDAAAAYEHIKRVMPAWCTVMDKPDLAKRISDLGVKVGDRRWNIEQENKTPAQLAAWIDSTVDPAHYYYVLNEPANDATVIQYLIDVCDKTNHKLLLGNLAHYGIGENNYGVLKKLLQRIAAEPDRLVLGIHEYSAAIITSGISGYAPEHGASAAQSNWPTTDDPERKYWHAGRYRFIVKYCEANNIAVPRMVVSEAGFDRLQDVENWLNTLSVTAPYTSIRGYKTLPDQWRQWMPGLDRGQAYAAQMRYAEQHIWQHPKLEGVTLFALNANPLAQWEQFDVAPILNAFEMADTTPPPAPPPDTPPEWTPSTQAADFSKCGYDTMETVKLTRGASVYVGNDQTALKFTQLTGFNTWEDNVPDPYATKERGGAFIVPEDAHLDLRPADETVTITKADGTFWNTLVYLSASYPEWVFFYGQRNSASVDADGSPDWWHVCAPLAVKTANYAAWQEWLTPETPPTTPPPPIDNSAKIAALKQIRDGINALIEILEQEQTS